MTEVEEKGYKAEQERANSFQYSRHLKEYHYIPGHILTKVLKTNILLCVCISIQGVREGTMARIFNF